MALHPEFDQDHVCDLVRKYVDDKGWTKREAAERWDCHPDTVSRVIHGSMGPTEAMLYAIGFSKEVERITKVTYRQWRKRGGAPSPRRRGVDAGTTTDSVS